MIALTKIVKLAVFIGFPFYIINEACAFIDTLLTTPMMSMTGL